MTTRNDMVNQIESLLGGGGSEELAEAMLPALEESGLIDFDGQRGYYFTAKYAQEENNDNRLWNKALQAAIELA